MGSRWLFVALALLAGLLPGRSFAQSVDVPILENQELWQANGPRVTGCGFGVTPIEAARGCMSDYEQAITSMPPSQNCEWKRSSIVFKTGSDKITPWAVVTWVGSSIPGSPACVADPVIDWHSVQVGKVWRNTCPANAEGSPANNPTSCRCKAGYVTDSTGKNCKPDCNPHRTISSGYYDIGPSAGAQPQLLGCKGKCEVIFDGESPSGSAMVNGEKHWFAKGRYVTTGGSCTAAKEDLMQVGAGTTDKPADTCAASQKAATMNGKTVCVEDGGDGKTPTEESKNKASKTTDKKTVTNPDGSETTTETTTEIDSNGNKKVTTTTTTKRPDGSSTTETKVENNGKNNAGKDSDSLDEEGGKDEGEEPEKERCEKNPSDTGCGGEPATVLPVYTKKDKTLNSVLSTHASTFNGSAFGTATRGFFSVSGGGSCPRWSAQIPYLETQISFDQMCGESASTAFAVLKVCVLLVASFFAFRVAVE